MKEMAEKCHNSQIATNSVASKNKFTNIVEIQKSNKLRTIKSTSTQFNNTLDDSLNIVSSKNKKDVSESSSSSSSSSSSYLLILNDEEINPVEEYDDVDRKITLKDDEDGSIECCTISDENITPSGDEITEKSHHHRRHQRDHDNIPNGIYLETPAIDENNISCINTVHDYENAKPKRISDDFFSSDDGDDGSSLITASCETKNSVNDNAASVTVSVTKYRNDDNSIEEREEILLVPSQEFLEDDTNSSCSNLMERLTNNLNQHNKTKQMKVTASSSSLSSDNLITNSEKSNEANDTADNDDDVETIVSTHPTTSSAESTVTYYDNDVQSMDAIERRDFEHEQRLTGGVIIKATSLVNSDNKLNLEFLKSYKENNSVNVGNNDDRKSSSDSKITLINDGLCTTPTSSKPSSVRLTKSTAKLNLSATLDRLDQHKLKELKDKPCSSRDNMNVTKVIPTASSSSSSGIPVASSSSSSSSLLSHCQRVVSKFDIFMNSNSNDSLSSDKSYNTSSNHSLKNIFNKTNINSNEKIYVTSEEISDKKRSYTLKTIRDENNRISGDNELSNNNLASGSNGVVYSTDPIPSTSSSSLHSSKCHSNFCYENSAKVPVTTAQKDTLAKEIQISNTIVFNDKKNVPSTSLSNSTVIVPLRGSSSSNSCSNSNNNSNNSNREICDEHLIDGLFNSKRTTITTIANPSSSSSSSIRQINLENDQKFEEATMEISSKNLASMPSTSSKHEQIENDFDDETDTWVDFGENSDEEICTCHNNDYTSGTVNRLNTTNASEDDLPSKDVDLSGYIQMVSISEDMFLQDNNFSSDLPSTIQRKRKLNDGRCVTENNNSFNNESMSERKRMAFDCASTPRSSQQQQQHTPTTTATVSSPSTTAMERRTPRSLIPTKDNPPPELQDWLKQFQRWSHVERLLAVDSLIERCEPAQVRHMMKVIEPQFQRDFISLLPKELALQVLSYLEPKDLLRAAQTCRSWRFLCDDNLLWKEKCRQTQIIAEPRTDRPKRGRAGNMPPISSPWKAAYMRQHIIEMNWRSRPIREPKILKGHDDHVITCLQFSGNRIVSGSDDNTLKVWSAVTGKCLRTLVGHTGGVWSSQMSGNIIISGSTDRTLKVWDMETGECIHTLLGHTSTVRCMHLHGKKVVSGSRDATLRVWDIEQGSCLHVLVGHLAAVRCVQYDGKLIVSGAYDYMVKVWHPERQECLHTLQGHTNRVYSLQFDGIHVVSGSLDTSIRVWDAETGNCKHTLMGHQSLTSGMELRQNILVSGNADSTVKVWDITTGQCLQTLSGSNKHQSAVTCLQFNSRFVITSSDDGTVKLWDVKTGEFIRNLVALDSGGSGGVVWRIRANDTKLICAVGSRNGTEETKLMVLDFDVEGACLKCS